MLVHELVPWWLFSYDFMHSMKERLCSVAIPWGCALEQNIFMLSMPPLGSIKLGLTCSFNQAFKRDEEYKAGSIRIWRKWQPRYTTAYGDRKCSPGSGATSRVDQERLVAEVRAEQVLRQDEFMVELDASWTSNEEPQGSEARLFKQGSPQAILTGDYGRCHTG